MMTCQTEAHVSGAHLVTGHTAHTPSSPPTIALAQLQLPGLRVTCSYRLISATAQGDTHLVVCQVTMPALPLCART